jgi:carbamoyl-phosphate synthase large subunit
MAIGRSFKEALQKGIRSLEVGRFGIGYGPKDLSQTADNELINFIQKPNPWRLYYIKQAFEQGYSIDTVYDLTKIDRWFLFQINQLVEFAKTAELTPASIRKAKQWGFSDIQLAHLLNSNELTIRQFRTENNIQSTFALVDTCAAEFVAETPYYYSTYETESEVIYSSKKKIMILGAGPNRIGQGIEFDYCCVHASMALREAGVESIMINSNPETVSTDFDISDKLYFEPLTFEDVFTIYEREKPEGVIVQFGGQTPLNISKQLEEAGAKILGTSSTSIFEAEDRKLFHDILVELNLKQPKNGIAYSAEEAVTLANTIHYPVLVRPSFVIGGTFMDIVYNDHDLTAYIKKVKTINTKHPILIDKYLEDAIEVDVDCLADGKECIVAAIMQHIEPAGIHSGDSACVLPAYSIPKHLLDELEVTAKKLAKRLHIVGLMNLQCAIKDGELYLIEVNPRASRTIPFVSKATGIPWAKLATKVILGASLKDLNIQQKKLNYYAVKEAVLPFNKFPESDILLSPEMKSTGESMGIDENLDLAFYKSQVSAGLVFPKSGKAFVSVGDKDKKSIIPIAQKLVDLGFTLVTTQGTCYALKEHNINSIPVGRISDGKESILDFLKQKDIHLAFNTASASTSNKDEILIRQQLVAMQVPYSTTIASMIRTVNAIEAYQKQDLQVKSIQEFIRS